MRRSFVLLFVAIVFVSGCASVIKETTSSENNELTKDYVHLQQGVQEIDELHRLMKLLFWDTSNQNTIHESVRTNKISTETFCTNMQLQISTNTQHLEEYRTQLEKLQDKYSDISGIDSRDSVSGKVAVQEITDKIIENEALLKEYEKC